MGAFIHGMATAFIGASFLAWMGNEDETSKHLLHTGAALALLAIGAQLIFK